MRKEKGFTLIELLAVIVILAIIALIATPIVLNIINVARKGAFARSAEGVVKSANLFYAQELIDNPITKDITFTCNNTECTTNDVLDANGNPSKLDVDGKVGTGTVTIYEDGKVSLTLTDGTNVATKEKDGKITVKKVNKEEEKKITITFDANGGTVSIPSKEVTVNGTYGELPVPTYTGYAFMGWYTSATDGTKIEESTPVTITENQTLYAQWKLVDTFTNKTYTTGDYVVLGGYKWHVIGDTGTEVTLLMDANQLGSNRTMKHCTNDTDASTDCGVDSTGTYYVYSWDKSLIRTYLNGELLTDLESKITNEIVSTPICADPSKNITGGLEQSYGGYLMSELNVLGKESSCMTQVSDKVRLISYSEYYNMSPYYTSQDANYPNVENITKILSDSDYSSWLYCNSINCGNARGYWWTMGSCSGANANCVRLARGVRSVGDFYNGSGVDASGVRPVVTIVK